MSSTDGMPAPADPPERLLERYLAGDDEAFGMLVARYEERLFVFIARMTGDEHLAEDVFQQVCLKLARNAGLFDGRASFSTWLFRIARNAALDEIRKRTKRAETALGDGVASSEPVDGAESPLARLTREELGARVRFALGALPLEQREAFLLKEEGELTFEEIGAVLHCGRETAKSRFRLAVEKLRGLLGGERPDGKGVRHG